MVDFAMVMGTGFAPFRAGRCVTRKRLLETAVDELDRLTRWRAALHRCDLLKQLAAEGKRFYED